MKSTVKNPGVKKVLVRTTTDFKTVTGIFVHEKGKINGENSRVYRVFTDKKIYCEIIKSGEILKTGLKFLDDLQAIRSWDNEKFGGNFE